MSQPDVDLSVGEYLRTADRLVRDLLWDTADLDAATVTSAWPHFLAAAVEAYQAVPYHLPADRLTPALTGDLPARLPRRDSAEPRLMAAADALTGAANLMRRHGQGPTSPGQLQDVRIARNRIGHTLLVGSHAARLALHDHHRTDPAGQATLPHRLRPLWAHLDRVEAIAGNAIDHPTPPPTAGEAGVLTGVLTDRLGQDLHRFTTGSQALIGSGRASQADLAGIANAHALVALHSRVILGAAADASRITAEESGEVNAVLKHAQTGWGRLSRAWAPYLMTGHASLDRDTVRAAAALAQTLEEITRSATGWARPAEVTDRIDPEASVAHLRDAARTSATLSDRYAALPQALIASGQLTGYAQSLSKHMPRITREGRLHASVRARIVPVQAHHVPELLDASRDQASLSRAVAGCLDNVHAAVARTSVRRDPSPVAAARTEALHRLAARVRAKATSQTRSPRHQDDAPQLGGGPTLT